MPDQAYTLAQCVHPMTTILGFKVCNSHHSVMFITQANDRVMSGPTGIANNCYYIS